MTSTAHASDAPAEVHEAPEPADVPETPTGSAGSGSPTVLPQPAGGPDIQPAILPEGERS